GRHIAIKDSDGINVVPSDDIDWIDAAGDYMCVHTGGRTLILRSTMKDLLEKLDDARFQRVHRSTIVNLSRIQQVVPLAKGDYTLHLNCGEQIRVSRNYRAAIKSFLDAIG
ncbi:MAG: LytTR family transcriptional regulator, partial [Gammaproteobacteria bacterium]|nr:LytTR family transcriptional regulator [Gammaproteobacteria bacterium]